MNAEPISKKLFDNLIAAGITEVKLSFSGGNDEGYLDVSVWPRRDPGDDDVRNLIKEIEDWAWQSNSKKAADSGIT